MSIRFNGLILSLVCAASLPHAAGLPPDPERPLWLRTHRSPPRHRRAALPPTGALHP
jgi:hypothetical protein